MRAVVRPAVHDAYWWFAAERLAILMRRARGGPAPWSADPILQRYRFCNVYRATDRVSQYLIRRVIYGREASGLPPEDVFLRIVLFRLFSKEATWNALEEASGGLRRRTLDQGALGDLLHERREREPIYTAAFILPTPNGYGHRAKHRNHLALVANMFRRGGLGAELGRARSLEAVYNALIAYPSIGPFLAYQIAIDLNYSQHLDFDEDEFTMPGPGALRGIKKVFKDGGGESPQTLIKAMVDRQEEEFARLGLDFEGLFSRRLKAIDCQGLFCETDKYSRARFPELTSNRVRIKQEFQSASKVLQLYLPPKWNLNERLGAEGVLAEEGVPGREAHESNGRQLSLEEAELRPLMGGGGGRGAGEVAPAEPLGASG